MNVFAAIVFVIACLAPGRSAATAQEPDLLLLEGKEEALHTNPLSDWLEKHP